ncbi:MAG: hypothetical protein KIT11_05960 [Fimbriimonadaceae bacterium]|nr:hypothetical protein [Fimbriimonadaceae bacterium]QYK55902.1 MAG: hypothetical protein KF733_00150 [Fimbriimonadaceae bacterium]
MTPQRNQSRIAILATAAFMLGFPALGLVWFWLDGHRRIQESAAPAAHRIAEEALARWDVNVLDAAGTSEFRRSDVEKAFEEAHVRLGPLKSLGEFHSNRSWAGGRDDMVWQFAECNGKASFQNGPAEIKMTVARRTMNPEWRVEKFEVR